MKTRLSYLQVFAASLLLTTGAASAQSTVTTTTRSVTSSDGTISELSPGVITIRSGASAAAPVAYSYSKTTTYVDEDGNPVSMETVRSGAPVTVYYNQDGNTMTASRVVVHRVETTSATPVDPTTVVKKTTTTTTTAPAP